MLFRSVVDAWINDSGRLPAVVVSGVYRTTPSDKYTFVITHRPSRNQPLLRISRDQGANIVVWLPLWNVFWITKVFKLWNTCYKLQYLFIARPINPCAAMCAMVQEQILDNHKQSHQQIRWWQLSRLLLESHNTYLIFAGGKNVLHPLTCFELDIIWGLRTGDAKTSSNF